MKNKKIKRTFFGLADVDVEVAFEGESMYAWMCECVRVNVLKCADEWKIHPFQRMQIKSHRSVQDKQGRQAEQAGHDKQSKDEQEQEGHSRRRARGREEMITTVHGRKQTSAKK